MLQGVYLLALGAIVAAAWPADRKLDLTNPGAARPLVELFFAGQFLFTALVTPAFAAGAITGEKERKSYEMLLASALRPAAIVRGKWAAAAVPALLFNLSSIPIVVLCLPLGGVSIYEVAAAYGLLTAAIVCFSLVSLTCSGFFARTTSALVTSYVVVLPAAAAMIGGWAWLGRGDVRTRLAVCGAVVPPAVVATIAVLFPLLRRRLWYPPDVGSEGKEVVDEAHDLRAAVGLVLRRHEFPDRLFAPAKRNDLLPDAVNPVLDKELRSELFSQGTLMLRLVLQISLLMSLPLMGACLYFNPGWAPWYVCYVLLFNLLAGPAFSAGSVSGERERRTLDLLLVTTLAPSTILRGKLLSGWRVSGILTSLLAWPLALAFVLVPEYYPAWRSFLLYFALIGLTSLATSTLSLFCSVTLKTSQAGLSAAYTASAVLFLAAPAADRFAQWFFPATTAARLVHAATATSPFAAAFALPLDAAVPEEAARAADWPVVLGHGLFQLALIGLLLGPMRRMFRNRYDAAGE